MSHRTRRVAVLLYPGFEPIDAIAPADVFRVAGMLGAEGGAVPPFEVQLVGTRPGPVETAGFLKLETAGSIDDIEAADVVVVPGGDRELLWSDERIGAWLSKVAPSADLMMTVCTGAFGLAAIGLLDGLEATTWHEALDDLAQRAPKVRVVRHRRFVESNGVLTTAGVSAGIDGALGAVARLVSPRLADRVASYIEYPWRRDEGRESIH